MMRWLKRIGIFVALLLAGLGGMVACNSLPQPVHDPQDDTLRLATYNVHYIWLDRATGDWSVADWHRRKAPLQAAFRGMNADIIAFQEMESFSRNRTEVNLTLDWLLDQNPDYAAAAQGDPAEFPSTQPIFYKPAQLTVRDQGWFFFSETPDVIYSRTFDGSFPAFATWAEFADRGGTVFRVYNLHTDYGSISNKQRSIELVAERISGPAKTMPVFVVGDFNAFRGSTTLRILEDAGVTFWPVQGSTYHFNRGLNLFPAIDHIGAVGNVQPVGPTFSVRGQFDGGWPTDHYPVVGDFRLP